MLLQILKLFSELLLNTYGLATSILAPVLGLGIAASASASCAANSTWIYACIATSCSCSCQIIV